MIKISQNDRFHIYSKRGGFVMALMLCTIVLVLIVGAGVLSFGLHSRGFAAHSTSEIAARSAADAGSGTLQTVAPFLSLGLRV